MSYQLVTCFCLAITASTLGKDLRIVGGTNVEIADYPYTASLLLMSRQKHICGGAIISHWHVLTAAHCVTDYYHFLITVLVGSTRLQVSTDIGYRINSIKIHPHFTGEQRSGSLFHNDIAIITLQRCIRFNEYQNKIRLPSSNVIEGSTGALTGWGMTNVLGNDHSEILQKSLMTVFDNFRCSTHLPFYLREEQLCVFNRKGVGSCYGDSGSPLVYNDELIGIGSFIRPCATGVPDIFTNVYSYLDFITTELALLNSPTC